jgi:hypothetical protein
MDKFNSQQDALRTAFQQVLGFAPSKGSLAITEEQRLKVGELMMEWLKLGRWSIRPGTRAFSNPFNYIVGKQPTCLIEAWVQPKQAKQAAGNDKFTLIKMALEAGLITKEQASAQFMELLNSTK